MLPELKFDFSRVTYSGVLEILAPVVPGTILALGALTLNPQLASRLLASPLLGYKSRLVAAILTSYIAGLLLNLLVNYIGYAAGYTIGQLFGQKLFPNPPTPWRNMHWRRMARTFLGNELAPSTDELYFQNLHQGELQRVQLIEDPQQRAAQQRFVQDLFLPKSIADNEWFWWYEVLAKYFSHEWWAAPWQYFVVMMHTASWAVILVMVLTRHHHWFAWAVAVVGIFFGNISLWFTGGALSDPFAVSQTAMLLRMIKPRAKEVSPDGTPTT